MPDRRDMVAMAMLVAALAFATIAWGERIGVNGGEGWDGRSYATWARDFPGEVLGPGVSAYQSQRVVPSAIVYYATAALGLPHTRAGVIVGFQLLDAACLVAAALLLYRIARALAWSRAAAWVAFAAVFESFAVARNALYYPTLTDPTALVLGAALVCAFLERRRVAIGGVAIVAAGTWPALLPLALAAVVLPRPRAPLPEVTGGWVRGAALAVAAASAGIVVLGLAAGLRHPYHLSVLAVAHRALFPITFATCAATAAAGAYAVARQPRTWALVAYARGLERWPTALALAAAAAIVAISSAWVRRYGTQGSGITLTEFRTMWAECALRAPLWGAVLHVAYFGPIVLVVIGAWRRVAEVIARWGPAAVAMAAMLLILSIATESRVMSHLFVFAAVSAVEATAGRWTARRALVFAALAAAWSKLWWKIGYDVPHDAWGWPDQRFTMHHGPWASDLTFLVHLAAAVITAVVLWRVLRSRDDNARRSGDLEDVRGVAVEGDVEPVGSQLGAIALEALPR